MTKVLCLDGGGIRGLYTIEVLKLIEHEVGNLNKYFDIIVGTSTGSIIATFLRMNYTANEIQEKYIEMFPLIFKNKKGDGLLKTQYENVDFIKCTEDIIKDAKIEKDLIITSINISKKRPLIFKFNNESKENLRDAIVSSCSSPVLFPPYQTKDGYLSDGGIILNNPSLVGFSEAMQKENGDISKIKIISIGTIFQDVEYHNLYNPAVLQSLVDSYKEETVKFEMEEQEKRKSRSMTSFISSLFNMEKFEKTLVERISRIFKIEEGALVSYADKYLEAAIDATTINTNTLLKNIFKSVNNEKNFLRINHGIKETLSLIEFKDEYYDLVNNDSYLKNKIKEFIHNKPNLDNKDIKIRKQKISLIIYRLILFVALISLGVDYYFKFINKG